MVSDGALWLEWRGKQSTCSESKRDCCGESEGRVREGFGSEGISKEAGEEGKVCMG